MKTDQTQHSIFFVVWVINHILRVVYL